MRLRPQQQSHKHDPEITAWAAWLAAAARRSETVIISAQFAAALARQLRALEREAAA